MTLQDYQKQIDDICQKLEQPYWRPLSQFARMAEEVGELGRVLNHLYGDKRKKSTETQQELEDELADVLFTVLCLANSQGIQLDKPIQRAIAKMQTRDKDRYPKKAA
jgi:NTP pyrophosphatase (non-canonical NTP hydrolase)